MHAAVLCRHTLTEAPGRPLNAAQWCARPPSQLALLFFLTGVPYKCGFFPVLSDCSQGSHGWTFYQRLQPRSGLVRSSRLRAGPPQRQADQHVSGQRGGTRSRLQGSIACTAAHAQGGMQVSSAEGTRRATEGPIDAAQRQREGQRISTAARGSRRGSTWTPRKEAAWEGSGCRPPSTARWWC
jgi:hypothetical protein